MRSSDFEAVDKNRFALDAAGNIPVLVSMGGLRLKVLEEFSLFVKYESAASVASIARITQSTLSKHMNELESVVGLRLFERGYRLELTPAGRQLALAVSVMLSQLVETCERLSYDNGLGTGELKVESGAYAFEARGIVLELLQRFMAERKDASFRMVPLVRNGLVGSLDRNEIDFGYWLDFGYDVDEIIAKRAQEGFDLVYLCTNDLVVWAHKDHPIFKLDHITVRDVAHESVMSMLNFNPNRIATFEKMLFRSSMFKGMNVRKDVRAAGSFDEFALMEPGRSIYVHFESFMQNQILSSRPDMIARRIEDAGGYVHSFMVSKSDTDNLLMKEFVRYVQKNADGAKE